MNSYITQEYDFFSAITKKLNLESEKYKGFAIDSINHIRNDMAIVNTTNGAFCCEGFSDDNDNIYMKVCQYV